MNRWLLKTDPDTYSLDDLERDKQTVWDGVSNPVALRHIGEMKKGDALLIYHTADEKCILGIAEAASDPYSDPKHPKLTVIDVKFKKRLVKPVTLAAVKADPVFADFALVRISRLSVMPVTEEQWTRLLKMAGWLFESSGEPPT